MNWTCQTHPCANLTNAADVLNKGAVFLIAIYFRRGLECTIGLANDLIDGGQPRAKNGY